MQALDIGERDDPKVVAAQAERELGLDEWWTPLNRRLPEPAQPRVTEEGLKVPSWWADDETESQRMLLAQGVIL